MTPRSVAWLPGYFTGLLHAAEIGQLPFLFHAVPIVWSCCGAPVAVVTPRRTALTCQVCAMATRT